LKKRILPKNPKRGGTPTNFNLWYARTQNLATHPRRKETNWQKMGGVLEGLVFMV